MPRKENAPDTNIGKLISSSKNLYHHLFENSGSVMLIIDPENSSIVDANKAAVEFYGYTKEKLLTMKVHEINTLTKDEIGYILKLASKTNKNNFSVEHRLASGEVRSIEIYSNPIEINDKVYLFAIIHDISEKKEMVKALIQSEENYRLIFESSMDGIFFTEPGGKIYNANPAAVKILGWTEEEICNMGRDKLIDITDSNLENALEERSRTGKFSGELRFIRKDGTTFPAEITSSLFTLKDGRIRTCIVFRDISEKKKVQENLNDNIELNNKIYDSSLIGEAVYNHSGQCISVNEKFAELIGATKTQLRAQNFRELLSWKKYGLFEIADEVLKTGVHIQRDIFMVTTFGKEIWMDFNAVRFISKGEPHLLIMVYNISERKHVEENLRISEERFRRVFEESPLGMGIVGLDFCFIKINSKFLQITGFDENELMQMTFTDITHPDDININTRDAQALINGDIQFYNIDKRYIRKDGKIIWVNLTSTVVRDKDGSPLYFISMIEDITERKKADEAIRESENKLLSIFHSAPIGMGLVSNRVLIMVNNEFCKILGYSSEELYLADTKLVYPTDEIFEQAGRVLYTKVAKNKSTKFETKLKRKGGSEIVALIGLSKFGGMSSESLYVFSIVDITERKITENILAESQAHLNIIINSSSDLIWSVDPDDFRLIKYNIAYQYHVYSYSGIKLHEGMTLEEIYTSDLVEVWKEFYKKTLEQGTFITEFTSERKNRSYLFSLNLLKHGDKVFGISVFGKDITETKQKENQIAQLVDDLQKAQRVSHVGSWKWYIQNNKQEWSDEMYNIFGIDKNSFTGSLSDIISHAIHPDDRSTVETSNLSVIQSNKPIPLEYRIVLPDKSIRTVWAEAGELIYDKDKQPYLLSGIVQDITEQKRIEIALRESKEMYSKLVSNIPDIIVRTDMRGNIHFINDTIIQYWGYFAPEKFLNKNLLTFVAEKDKQRAQKNLNRIFNERVGLQEYTVVLEDRELECEVNGDVLIDSNNQPYGMVFVIRNITERKKAEKELEKYQHHLEELVKERTNAYEEVNRRLENEILKVKEAEEKVRSMFEKEKELNELKSKFISITSHEFRTPLTTLLSSFEILEMAGKNYSENKKKIHYEKIRRNIEYLVNMIDELLYMNRIDSNKINVCKLKTNIKNFCSELFDEIKSAYLSVQALIEFNLDQTEYDIDRSIMHKILGNLIINAFKYNNENGKVIFIISAENDKLCFRISDTGIGIPEEEQKGIFEPFTRMSNSRHIKGTGLGLSIVKKSVDTLNGIINFTSKKDAGTEFTVLIPKN